MRLQLDSTSRTVSREERTPNSTQVEASGAFSDPPEVEAFRRMIAARDRGDYRTALALTRELRRLGFSIVLTGRAAEAVGR